MRTASWVLLTIVGGLTLLVSLISANLAYRGDYPIAGVRVDDVAAGRPAVLSGLRGIRGTSAAYAAAYAVLFLTVTLVPYRRGEVWAWWALAAAMATLLAVVALRLPLLDTRLGLGAPLIACGIGTLGLLLDVRRLGASRPS